MSDRGCSVDAGCSADGSPPRAERSVDAPQPAAPLPASEERSRRTPRRTVVNFWVDLGLGVMFLSLTFTAGVIQFVFPNGPIAFESTLWGGDYADWHDLQFGLLAALGLGVLLHVMLHWNWLCCVTNTHVRNRPPGRDDGSRTLLGVGLLVLLLHLLAAGLLLARWSLQTS